MQAPKERFVHSSVTIMLLLALCSALCGTLIHWLEPHPQRLDLIIPPIMSAIFGGLLVALKWWPARIYGITQCTMLTSIAALVVPTWYDLWKVGMHPGLKFVAIFPPISSLLLVLMIIIMLMLPARRALGTALVGWCLIAIPILIYLFTHPAEMWSARGKDMLMSYGPALMVLLVVIPFKRGMNQKIEVLVSERAQMKTMADRDPLTHLLNRRPCEQILNDIFGQQGPAGVVLFDLDRFKTINDNHGHLVGDQILKTVAERCEGILRKGGYICRWGGEEFLIVLPNVDESSLRQVAERLRHVIAQSPIEPAGQVTASFGITLVQRNDDLSSLLGRADQALYQAKHQGRNCVVLFHQGLEGDPRTIQAASQDDSLEASGTV